MGFGWHGRGYDGEFNGVGIWSICDTEHIFIRNDISWDILYFARNEPLLLSDLNENNCANSLIPQDHVLTIWLRSVRSCLRYGQVKWKVGDVFIQTGASIQQNTVLWYQEVKYRQDSSLVLHQYYFVECCSEFHLPVGLMKAHRGFHLLEYNSHRSHSCSLAIIYYIEYYIDKLIIQLAVHMFYMSDTFTSG